MIKLLTSLEIQVGIEFFQFMMLFKWEFHSSRIHEITKIDIWFLKQYEELINLEKEISKYNLDYITKRFLIRSKTKRIC